MRTERVLKHHRTPSVRIARLFALDYGESFKISNLALYYSESASHSSRTDGLKSLSAMF
jgi:hypothetical protein